MSIVLTNIIAIYRRELQSYFVSPLAYAIASVFWLLAGLLFVISLLGPPEVGVIQTPRVIDVPYEFVRVFLYRIGLLLSFVLPILSMGLYAEERKQGTLELLATSPVTNWAVAVGKLLGVLTFFITIMIPVLVLEAIALSASSPPMPPAIPLLANVACILLAATMLSLGMFISSLTESTILSAIFSFAAIFMLLLVPYLIADKLGGLTGELLGTLSLLKQYNTLVQGIFDTSSLIVFASYIFLGIFLTAQSIDALRFHGH